MGTIQLGLCQMKVTADKAENLRTAEEAIRTAARQGAELVLLPEMFNCPYENACFPVYGLHSPFFHYRKDLIQDDMGCVLFAHKLK